MSTNSPPSPLASDHTLIHAQSGVAPQLWQKAVNRGLNCLSGDLKVSINDFKSENRLCLYTAFPTAISHSNAAPQTFTFGHIQHVSRGTASSTLSLKPVHVSTP